MLTNMIYWPHRTLTELQYYVGGSDLPFAYVQVLSMPTGYCWKQGYAHFCGVW
jgi:hypothetical protein